MTGRKLSVRGREWSGPEGQRALFEADATPGRLRGDARDVERRRVRRATVRDVYIRDVEDPERVETRRLNLRAFCETYMPGIFCTAWSADHLTIISGLEDVVLKGTRSVFVAPRGTGKSSLTIAACIWALLYGHRRFLVILCHTHEHSVGRLDSIRTLMETNDLLFADFPAPCACTRTLEGKYNRAPGQTVCGKRTHIHWGGTTRLVFPTIEGVASSGSVIACKSMDKAIRGLNYTTVEGSMVRPDLVLIDDPFKPEEAESEAIMEKLERRIVRDVLQMGGPDTTISCIYLGTIVARGDLTERMAARPEWRSRKFKLLYAMPENEKLWEQYNELRIQSLQEREDVTLGTEFYEKQQEEMDRGAKPAWAERYRKELGEISAVQFAMDLYYEDEDMFLAEYQNEPRSLDPGEVLTLDAERVATTDSGLTRGVVPEDSLALVSGWDIGKQVIHWTVGAVCAGRQVAIIDYGTEEVFAPAGADATRDQAEFRALELALLSALRHLRDTFLSRPYYNTREEAAPILFTLVDARYLSQVIQSFCQESGRAFGPIMGRGSGRNQLKWTTAPKGAQLSPDRNLYVLAERGGMYTYHSHADAYKQMLHAGFLLDWGQPGSISLFTREQRTTHYAFSHQIVAERQYETEGGQYVWKKAERHGANHWLDACCYMMAAASALEYRIPAIGIGVGRPAGAGGFRARPKTRRVSVVEM